MRTITGEQDTIVCFDYDVYKQERNLIHFYHDGGNVNLDVRLFVQPSMGAQFEQIATYHMQNIGTAFSQRGYVCIDVTDYLRAYPNTAAFRTQCQKLQETLDVPLRVVGLINPASVLIPHNVNIERMQSILSVDWQNTIVPPQMMLKDINKGNATRLQVEFWPTYADTDEPYFIGAEDVPVTRAYTIPQGENEIYTFNDDRTDLGDIQHVTLRTLACDRLYAAVRWVSFTGETRLHTFEVRDARVNVANAYALETRDNSYNTIKGREDGFTLHLDGLNAYDMWYYGDVVLSSKVEVSFDGVNWAQVDVTDKGVEIPDGDAGEFSELNVQVNWKKYDAVNM